MQTEDSIHPVILCGGAGTRLWPLSRKDYPKQFLPLVGEDSLFQGTIRRLSGPGFADPVVVTAAEFRFVVAEQLAQMGRDGGAILIEPAAKNTAPAVIAAALAINEQDPEGLALVAPCDHLIPDAALFRATVERGLSAAKKGQIVTFGVAPTRPETGFGYIEAGEGEGGGELGPRAVKRFVEKPNLETAKKMLASGGFLWNAGLFLFKVSTILEAAQQHCPEILAAVIAAHKNAARDLDFIRLDAQGWSASPSQSIDYAIAERARNMSVVPYHGGWSDLGGWDAVHAESSQDGRGVAGKGHVTSIDCENSLLRSDDEGIELVGVGLKDIVAVATRDAVLVANLHDVQKVKNAVDALKSKGKRQAEQNLLKLRPWGSIETLVEGPRLHIRRIVMKEGAHLTSQSHDHRSEHWVIVRGQAKVTIGESVLQIGPNASVGVPKSSRHQLFNVGAGPLEFIEVQTGEFIDESDVVRYDGAPGP